MFVKHTLSVAAAVLVLSSGAAFAETKDLQVSIEADVPSPTGLQIGDFAGWTSLPQKLAWDLATQTLKPLAQQLDLKSSLGEITAYLTTAAVITSASNSIPLTVTLHGKDLDVGEGKAVVVLTALEAAASKRINVAVVPGAAPEGGYVAGQYAGNVFIMFESVAPS